jgi:hypothetical protein
LRNQDINLSSPTVIQPFAHVINKTPGHSSNYHGIDDEEFRIPAFIYLPQVETISQYYVTRYFDTVLEDLRPAISYPVMSHWG